MTMRFMVLMWMAAACFGQGEQNAIQKSTVEANEANRIPPTATFASPPASPAPWAIYLFKDANAAGSCSGGGSALATCQWSGNSWSTVGPGGRGSGQASIFNGWTLPQGQVECLSGTTSYAALTAAAANQEVTIQTGISGNVRWDHIQLSETTLFAGTTGLTVSMGRPGTNNTEMTGAQFPLMVSNADANYLTARPIPPQLTGTYSIVLNFAVTAGNVNAATAGALTWEVCGYAAR